jgi:hypothetical protein
MAVGYSTTIRNDRLTQVVNACSNGFLRIYDGSRPATGGSVTTLLAELRLAGPSATVSGGVATFASITADSSANNTGTATWARIVAGDGSTHVADYSVSTSGADINFDNLAFTQGGTVSISSFTTTEGNA